jgi:hypothetical protein
MKNVPSQRSETTVGHPSLPGTPWLHRVPVVPSGWAMLTRGPRSLQSTGLVHAVVCDTAATAVADAAVASNLVMIFFQADVGGVATLVAVCMADGTTRPHPATRPAMATATIPDWMGTDQIAEQQP